MHKLLEFVCDEMEELERKADKEGKLSMAEIQYLDTLAHTKKNLLTADAMMEEGDYSNMGGSYESDGYGGSYARGGRGGNRGGGNRGGGNRGGGRSNRGSYYSREGGYSREGYSRGEDMAEELRELMDKAPNEQARKEIERLAMKLEQME